MRTYHATLPKRKTVLNNSVRGWRLKKQRYGITKDEYLRLKEKQGNLCAICLGPETLKRNGRVVSLCVDHNHQNGRVRSLLCHACNAGIGLFRESKERMCDAIRYIELHEEKS